MAENATPILWAGHPLYISKDGRMDSLDEAAVQAYDAAQERLQRETNESQAAMAALIKQESEAMTNATNDDHQNHAGNERVPDGRGDGDGHGRRRRQR